MFMHEAFRNEPIQLHGLLVTLEVFFPLEGGGTPLSCLGVELSTGMLTALLNLSINAVDVANFI